MTANPKSVSVDETVENCLYLMREFGFRHLPIVDGKELKGLVSSRDILLRYISQQEAEPRRRLVPEALAIRRFSLALTAHFFVL